MKKLTSVAFFLVLAISLSGQDISGQWNGVLKVGAMQLRIVFNVTKTDAGYSSTMDSPDQGAYCIPVSTTTFENMVLKFEAPNLGIQYEGTLDKSNEISGNFRQSGQSFPLILSRQEHEKETVLRPQEPVKPYPYVVEDIVFENKKDTIQLAGTLTLPKQTGSFPAVVLISGSGPQNRDEELMGHKPFLVWADYLTRNGIAVLRFDDRGTAASKGNFKTAITPDFASDVEAAVQYLKTRKEIDKKKIGLIGHSEGGIIAPMVAAGSKDISFIVLLAGTGVPGNEILLLQQELIGRANGASEAELLKSKLMNKGAFDIIINTVDNSKRKADLSTYLNQVYEQDTTLEIPQGMTKDELISKQVSQLTSPWMVYFITHDPAPVLQKVKCAVLAVNGDKDLQVPAQVNLDAIKKALEKGGNKKVTTRVFPGLNHLFQECKTGSPSEYAGIEQTISPVVLEEVTQWIVKQTK